MSLKSDCRMLIRRVSDDDVKAIRDMVEAEVERRLAREQNSKRLA